MRIEVEAGEQALARHAADVICGVVRSNPEATLGLPTGATPVSTYAELERRADAADVDFSRATAYAVDEFATEDSGPRLSRTTPGTNSAFFDRYLRVRFRALRCPDPAAADPGAEIRSFAEGLRQAGGLDLCVLGIGVNGHVAFNEPGSAADSRARAVPLTGTSREAHAESFGSLDRVPAIGMTLGIADLLESRRLLVIALGEKKAAIVRAALRGPETAQVPATLLRRHPNVTWLLDRAAASLLEE